MSEKKRYIFLLIIMENVRNIHLHVKIDKGDSFKTKELVKKEDGMPHKPSRD